MNKKICFVSDVKGWAFDVTAAGLRPYLDFDLLYSSDEPRVTEKDIARYKYVHFFNWLGGQSFAHLPNVSAGVCQHGFEMKWQREAKKYIPKFSKMVAISKELYEKISPMNPETVYIPNGVDTEMFAPVAKKGDKFTVGWCGQKTGGGYGLKKGSEGRPVFDIKGYELLLQPLMKRLEGKVTFKINSNDYKIAIPHSEMPLWYRDVDCFICTAAFEGGPLTVLEAAACGIPVISTSVGIVPELIQHGYNGYLIPQSKKELFNPYILYEILDMFESYISRLRDGKSGWCNIMGERLRESVESSWDWKYQAKKWKAFFNED